jgi:hypothetical protein
VSFRWALTYILKRSSKLWNRRLNLVPRNGGCISKCRRCATVWLIAQDDRIYDIFLLVRSTDTELADALAGRWPQQFQTYEDVLASARRLSNPPQFFDPMGSLRETAVDLLEERPNLSAKEIGYLLGLSDEHASALLTLAVAGFDE